MSPAQHATGRFARG